MRVNTLTGILATGVLVLACDATPAKASALSDAAAALQPGQWMVFQTQGYGTSLLDACNGANNILEWSNKASWDPVRREVHFVGQGHTACAKHIRYQESTNSWTTAAIPTGIQTFGHGYEHNAINPATGELYWRVYGSDRMESYNPGTGTWSALPAVGTSTQVAGAIAYFPERSGLVFVDGDYGVFFFNSSARTWTRLASGNGGAVGGLLQAVMGPYHNFASYNPIAKAVFFGGGNGSTNVYQLDQNGNLTQIANSPVPIGIKSAMTVPDPATGAQLVFADNGNMYAYDIAGRVWRNNGTHPVMSYALDWRVSVPITNYGVIMVLTWDFANSKVLLYKHAAGGGVVPQPPGALTAQ